MIPTWVWVLLIFVTYTTIIHYYELQKGYSGDSIRERVKYAVMDNADIEHLKSLDYTINPHYDKKMRNGVEWFMHLFGFDKFNIKYDFDIERYKIVADESYKKKTLYKVSLSFSRFLTFIAMLLVPIIHFDRGRQKQNIKG